MVGEQRRVEAECELSTGQEAVALYVVLFTLTSDETHETKMYCPHEMKNLGS